MKEKQVIDKQKLNEKIAKWLKFEYICHTISEPWVFKPNDGNNGIEIHGNRWITPDGNAALIMLPLFTDSMDACEKWIVPELIKRGIRIDMIYYTVGGCSTCLRDFKNNIAFPDTSEYKISLAFCLALEQYIDWRNSKS